MFEKKGGVKKEILKIEKLQEKEIKDEYKHEMAEVKVQWGAYAVAACGLSAHLHPINP